MPFHNCTSQFRSPILSSSTQEHQSPLGPKSRTQQRGTAKQRSVLVGSIRTPMTVACSVAEPTAARPSGSLICCLPLPNGRTESGFFEFGGVDHVSWICLGDFCFAFCYLFDQVCLPSWTPDPCCKHSPRRGDLCCSNCSMASPFHSWKRTFSRPLARFRWLLPSHHHGRQS